MNAEDLRPVGRPSADMRSLLLQSFLSKAIPIVESELNSSIHSHAFDDYSVAWEEKGDTVQHVATLGGSGLSIPADVMCCVDVAWNCNGSLLAVAFAFFFSFRLP